ncbi:hypothetical protein MKX03_024678, partial [Papaver bracteatum]
FSGTDTPPARIFGWRVLELKEQGVSEEEAIAMEYQQKWKAMKAAYKRLKEIARLQGEKPPPNPYPSAIKEIQVEERKYAKERFNDPSILEIVQRLKDERFAFMQERRKAGGW